MAMRLNELHPSASHFPIALLPVSIGTDFCGYLFKNDALLTCGRLTMPMTAAAALITGTTGLIAQEQVNLDEEGRSMLWLHRNINIAALGFTTAMAAYRVGRHKPGAGYFVVGAASLGAVIYSAYLGGKMVYSKGVGVEAAEGVREEEAPELLPRNLGRILRTVGRQLRSGIRHTIEGFVTERPGFVPEPKRLQRDIDEAGSQTAPKSSP